MKAERRHELQTNSLSKVLADLPLYIRFHSNKILIGIIFICLFILLIRYRTTAARNALESTHAALIAARSGVNQMRLIEQTATNDSDRFQARAKTAREVQAAVEAVLEGTSDADDPTFRAEAQLARGDLNWTLANLPPLAGAATQPQLAAPQSPTQYLDNAEAAYQTVVKNYPDNVFARTDALLALAAIAENRGDWDAAHDFYKKIAADDKIAGSFKMIANSRDSLITQLKKPVFLGSFPASQPSTNPSSQPASAPSMMSATMPASQPATMP